MSISAPPGEPSIAGTLTSSFRDGAAVAKSNTAPALMLIVLGTVATYFLSRAAISAPANAPAALPSALDAAISVFELLLVAIAYYAMAASVRTIHQDFRMTFGRFLGVVGYSLLVGLLTILAGIAFVIPAYWVGVKLAITPYTYLLTDGAPGAVKTTWNMTTGYYWQTVGMFLLAGLCLGVIGYTAFFICAVAVLRLPISAIVLAPLTIAVLVWLMHVQALIYVRWTNGLLPRATLSHGIPVPA